MLGVGGVGVGLEWFVFFLCVLFGVFFWVVFGCFVWVCFVARFLFCVFLCLE